MDKQPASTSDVLSKSVDGPVPDARTADLTPSDADWAEAFISGRAARYLRVRRHRLQLPTLYPLAVAGSLILFWALLVLSQRALKSELSNAYSFELVFSFSCEEAWYALAVVAALVVALHVVALGAAVIEGRYDEPSFYEQVARGRQLQLLARLAAVVASVVAVDAVIHSARDVTVDSPFRLTESAVLILVSYILAAFAEDAARRAVGPRQATDRLKSAVRLNEQRRLHKARIFWRPSQPRWIRSGLRLLTVSLLVVAGCVACSALHLWDAAGALLLLAGVLSLGALVAAAAGLCAAFSVLTRLYLVGLLAIFIVFTFVIFPLLSFIAALLNGSVGFVTKAIVACFSLAWLFPWALVLHWLLAPRPDDPIEGKRDVLPALSTIIVRLIDSSTKTFETCSYKTSRTRRIVWWERVTGSSS